MRLFKLIVFCLGIQTAVAQGEYISLEDSTELYLIDQGKGQAMVFIPGWTMTHRFFEHQQSYFSTYHRVITYDPRGQGRSDKTQYKNTYADHAEDLRELILKKGLNDIVLVGWSSGCLTIYEYLKQFGTDKLQKLIFIDEPPKWIGDSNTEWVYGTFDDYRSSLKDMISEPSDPNGIIDWMLVNPVDPSTREWMNGEMKLTPPEVALNLYIDGLASDYNSELAYLADIPALFMVREAWYDQVVDWAPSKAPSAGVVSIPSHAIFWEQPEAFNAMLQRFIESEEGTSGGTQTISALIGKADMLLPRYGPTAATDGEWIYIYGGAPSGGRNGDDFMHAGLHSSIERIDPQTLKAEYLSGGLHRRANHASVFFDDKIVTCGGRSQIGLDRPRVASCEFMDLAEGVHKELPALPEALRTLGMTVVGDHIYVVGGLTDSAGYSDRTYRLSKGADAWERMADAPWPVEGSIIAVDSDIYVVGGYNGKALSTVMVFDSKTNQWHQREPLSYGLSAYSAVAKDNSIFIFGDYEQMDAIHRYDLSSGELHLLDQKITPRRHTAAVLIGDEAFVIGGNRTSAGKALTTVEVFSLSVLKEQP